MKKEIVRRSISIPKDIDERVQIMAKKYSYNVKNDLYIELLELGAIKFDEDLELRKMITDLLSKLNIVVEKLENK